MGWPQVFSAPDFLFFLKTKKTRKRASEGQGRADSARAEGTGGVPLSPRLENGRQEKYESEPDRKVQTQGIPLREGGSLFLSELAHENLITSSDWRTSVEPF